MVKKIFLCSIIAFLLKIGEVRVEAQSTGSDPNIDLLKVIPASPTSASLGIYGSTPVGFYTGTPNISIPLFDITSGSISLPVNLSHHGGGIKVEEMASWVGLGWSLNAGGVITRTVRGIPDDVANGFFNQPMKVQFMIDNGGDPQYHDQIKIYMGMAGYGGYDTEADIFYFNFGGVSGKFFYDQESEAFYTIPRTNNKIVRAGTDFVFTAENGNKYFFTAKEFTNSIGSVCTPVAYAPSVNIYSNFISSWFLTKIENADATDEITFDYADNFFSFQNISSSTGYILKSMSGTVYGPLPDMTTTDCYQWPQFSGKKLSYIHFKNGYLKFNANSMRCDLPSDEALDDVELYNEQNQLLKRFKFEYGYFGVLGQPSFCGNELAANSTKLQLKKLTEENVVNGILAQKTPHIFEYDESGLFPNRLSFAQDHWGYYNGANSNTSLMPATFYTPSSGIPMWWAGADRFVNPATNKIGSLVKITYPTGGTSAFEYESNEIKDPQLELDPVFTWTTKSIEGDHNGGVQTYYESAPFVINEPPSSLNGQHVNGGAFVSEMFTEIGSCGYPGSPVSSCAVLNVVPLSVGAIAWGPFNENINEHYLPNGTYKLTASFQQVPAGYQDFFFQVKWRSIATNPNVVNTTLVGGLRVKKITDYDGVNHSNDIIKNFSYKNETDDYSSGKINGKPSNYTIDNYEQLFFSVDPYSCTYHSMQRFYIKRNSYSNYPLLTSSGSYVGYGNVSITYGNNGLAQGKTNYSFENDVPDLIWGFPHPVLSYDWRRGFLKSEKQYKNVNNNLVLVSKKDETYSVTNQSPVATHKSINGLKVGYLRDCGISNYAPLACLGLFMTQIQNEYKMPVAEEYETVTDYVRHIGTTTTEYDQDDVNRKIISTQEIEYNDLSYRPNKIKVKNSKQEDITAKTQYPVDYPTAPIGSYVRNLLDKNMLTIPVEKYTIKKIANGQEYVIGGRLTTYKNNQPVPDKIYSLEITEPIPLGSFTPSYYTTGGVFTYDQHYKEQISFNAYDLSYNLKEQQKTNDVKEVYLYGYKSSYPVAKILNSDLTTVNQFVNQSILDDPSNDQAVRDQINNIRAGLVNTNAIVTTYTYKPLVGITSETDARGKITYYEYDRLNRLALIRDHNKNIIKKICYNYAGQTEDCTIPCIDFSPIWQNTTEIRCQQGTCGNTGYQELKQIDVNPCNDPPTPPQWVVAGYNPTACPVATCVNLTSTNVAGSSGYTATYLIGATPFATFNVSTATGLQPLGTIPAGNYTLTIQRTTGSPINGVFKSGCYKQIFSGSSATFYNVAVSPTTCNSITVDISGID